MMHYKNVVVDDLREFVNVPKCQLPYLLYLKTVPAAHSFFQLYDELEIENLWLDHDMGLENTRSLARWLAEQIVCDLRKIHIDNVYIITANPSGSRYLLDLAIDACHHTAQIVQPVNYGLVCSEDW